MPRPFLAAAAVLALAAYAAPAQAGCLSHGCQSEPSCCAPTDCCPAEPSCCAPTECCTPAAPTCCAPSQPSCCPAEPSCCAPAAPAECCAPAAPSCCAPTECCTPAAPSCAVPHVHHGHHHGSSQGFVGRMWDMEQRKNAWLMDTFFGWAN